MCLCVRAYFSYLFIQGGKVLAISAAVVIPISPVSLPDGGRRRRFRPISQQSRIGSGVQVVEVAAIRAYRPPGTLRLVDRYVTYRTSQRDVAGPVCRLHQYSIAARTIDISRHRSIRSNLHRTQNINIRNVYHCVTVCVRL